MVRACSGCYKEHPVTVDLRNSAKRRTLLNNIGCMQAGRKKTTYPFGDPVFIAWSTIARATGEPFVNPRIAVLWKSWMLHW